MLEGVSSNILNKSLGVSENGGEGLELGDVSLDALTLLEISRELRDGGAKELEGLDVVFKTTSLEVSSDLLE